MKLLALLFLCVSCFAIDKVIPLKFGPSDWVPTELSKETQYISAKGVSFEGKDFVTIASNSESNQLVFSDSFSSSYTLTQLRTAVYNSFDNATNSFSASNVQTAIEEARSTSYANDRYPIAYQYGGNAGVGRYLECFFAISSDEAPHIFPENGRIKTITIGAAASTTVTIGFFKMTDTVNPVFSVSLSGQITSLISGVSYDFNAMDTMAARVTSGSANKPYLRVWINNRN